MSRASHRSYQSPFADEDQDMFLDLALNDDHAKREIASRQASYDQNTTQPGLSESAYQAILNRISRNPTPDSRLQSSQNSGFPAHHRLSASSSYHTPRDGSPIDGVLAQDDHRTPRDGGREYGGGSDSPPSNIAPSIVWDELDDLRSRLNKLEMAEQIASYADDTTPNHRGLASRATTTAPTTVSSGPRPSLPAPSMSAKTIIKTLDHEDVRAQLHDALTQAKALLEPRLFRLLETSASEALALGDLAESMSPKDAVASAYSIINGDADNNRELLNRVISMHRSLTDLCLHLCDAKDGFALPDSSPLVMARLNTSSRQTRGSMGSSGVTPALSSRLQASRSISRLNAAPLRIGSSSVIVEPSISSPRSPRDAKDYTAKYTLESRRDSRSRQGVRVDDEIRSELPIRSVSRAATDFERTPSKREYPPMPPLPARERRDTGTQRSPSLHNILSARRTSSNIQGLDARSEVYTPSSRALSSVSRRQTLEPRDFRKATETSDRDRRVSRLSLLGRYATSSEVGERGEPTPDALKSGALGPLRRPRPNTTLLEGSNYVSRVR